jgi:hypothetical protein
VKIIACIEDPVVIENILTHLNKKAAGADPLACLKAGPSLKQCCLTDPKETNQPEVPLV